MYPAPGPDSHATEQLVRCQVRQVLQQGRRSVRPLAKHARQADQAILDVVENLKTQVVAAQRPMATLSRVSLADESVTIAALKTNQIRRRDSSKRTGQGAPPGGAGLWQASARTVQLNAEAAGTAPERTTLARELNQAQEGVEAEREFYETQFEFADFQDPLLCFVRAQVNRGRSAAAAAQEQKQRSGDASLGSEESV